MKRILLSTTLLFVALVAFGAPKAKYVFYFIGDGMGINQVYGTELYNAMLRNSDLPQDGALSFTNFAVRGRVYANSASSLVTDSSAAGTALSCGVKTANGYTGVNATGKSVENIAEAAKNNGMKVGIVTNVGLNHATPSAFYAHIDSRNNYPEMATQLFRSKVDFVAGSTFIYRKRHHKTVEEEIDEAQSYGILVTQSAEEAAAAHNRRVILISDSLYRSSLRYAIDRREGEPTVVDYTSAAIRYLERESDKKGFFLMVEGGKIDYACHSNDAVTMFGEINDLSASVELALEFARRHPKETLIVVTADHETGGFSVGYRSYKMKLARLKGQTCSVEVLTHRLQYLRQEKKTDWESVRALLDESLGLWSVVHLSEKEEKALYAVYEKSFLNSGELVKDLYTANEKLASRAVRLLQNKARLAWIELSHTGAEVPFYAEGVGANLFHNCHDNTDLPKTLAKAMGIKFGSFNK